MTEKVTPEVVKPEIAKAKAVVKSLRVSSAMKAEAVDAQKSKIDAQGRAQATGRRKDAIARVWIKPGSGKVVVNNRDWNSYFARPTLRMIINQPLEIVQRVGQYDIICTVVGGGLSGQAGALRHGLSRALINFEPELRGLLKAGGFLTRDSRTVERKKFGRAKARRRFQFSNR